MTMVTYPRVQAAEDGSPQEIALNPQFVAAVFSSENHAGASILRLASGPGFLVAKEFDELRSDYAHMVALSRPMDSGEDELPTPILINPRFVAAIAQSAQDPDVVIIKLPDGRGLKVLGTYSEVRSKLGISEGAESFEEGLGTLQ